MNLKQLFGGLFAAVMMTGAVAMADEAAAEKEEWIPDISLSAKWASRYLSKGAVVNPDPMMFYDFSVSKFGFYAGVWAAEDMTNYNKHDKIGRYDTEEVDYYIGYSYTFEELPVLESLTIDACYTYYDYPKRSGWQCVGEQQHEYALSLNAGCFLNPGIQICWCSETEKWYGNLNAGWEYNFKDEGVEALTFGTGIEAWWGNNVFARCPHHDNDLAISTICWGVKLNYAITENISIEPFAQLCWAVDPEIRKRWNADDSANAKQACNTLWGVKLSFEY